eukprot:2544672-Rhodomonas_salina.2
MDPVTLLRILDSLPPFLTSVMHAGFAAIERLSTHGLRSLRTHLPSSVVEPAASDFCHVRSLSLALQLTSSLRSLPAQLSALPFFRCCLSSLPHAHPTPYHRSSLASPPHPCAQVPPAADAHAPPSRWKSGKTKCGRNSRVLAHAFALRVDIRR